MTTGETPKLIKTRRSCIGCGLRPGALHSNGLCRTCQTPPADAYAPVGNEDTAPSFDDVEAAGLDGTGRFGGPYTEADIAVVIEAQRVIEAQQ